VNALTEVAIVFVTAAATIAPGATTERDSEHQHVGDVRDSGCVHRFHEVIKPLPNGCVEACVRGGVHHW
jgi:hypothetical protein